MIETGPRRACGLRWLRFWRLRVGEWRTRAAATWRDGGSKVRFLGLMLPWTWP